MSCRCATRYTPWLLALWITALIGGVACLHAYGGTPAPQPEAWPTWPDDTALGPAPEEACLLFFVHPRCPCTAASVDELAALLRDLPPHAIPVVRVIWREPADGPSDAWSAPSLRAAVDALPRVTVTADPGGTIARAFGATASGTVLSFDAHPRCHFRGGLTASRGHRGPSPGRAALRAALIGERTSGAAPVFGCPLHDAACRSAALTDPCDSIENSR